MKQETNKLPEKEARTAFICFAGGLSILLFHWIVYRDTFTTAWINHEPIYGFATFTGMILFAVSVQNAKRSILSVGGALLMSVQPLLQLNEFLSYEYAEKSILIFNGAGVLGYAAMVIFLLRRMQEGKKGMRGVIAVFFAVFYLGFGYKWISVLEYAVTYHLYFILQAIRELLIFAGLLACLKAYETVVPIQEIPLPSPGISSYRRVNQTGKNEGVTTVNAYRIRKETIKRKMKEEEVLEESEYEILPEDRK